LLRSCAEVHEPIELSFGEVSGVTSGIRASRGRVDFGGHLPPLAQWFQWRIL